MKKRRRDDTSDNPLGIGLSKRTLVLIGIGLAGVIAWKVYQAKKRGSGAGPSPLPAPTPSGPHGTLSGMMPEVMMNGHHPPSTVSPPDPPQGSPAFGTAAQSPPSVREPSRASYDRAGGFSGLGDGGLTGGNSRM